MSWPLGGSLDISSPVAFATYSNSIFSFFKGKPKDWFEAEFPSSTSSPGAPDSNIRYPECQSEVPNSYRQICKSVVKDYYAFFLPCTFVLPAKGFHKAFKCDLFYNTHRDMPHRQKTKFGVRQYYGKFENDDFDPERFAWDAKILKHMNSLDMRFDRTTGGISSRQASANAHRQAIIQFYDVTMKGRTLFSNRICLFCLANRLMHRLRCGHIMCL